LRAAWLDRLGPEYADVLPTLRELLRRQTGNDPFLNTMPTLTMPPDALRASLDAHLPAPGAIVGPYKLSRELGRGGMGEVWLAERADGSLKRPVALKLPIISLRNRAFAERFSRERDILAQLTHPEIARLYDAGGHRDGPIVPGTGICRGRADHGLLRR
jgi:serine/threonine-protein kinase